MSKWVKMNEYPNYEIRDDGAIRNGRTKKRLQTYKTDEGYEQITLIDIHGLRRTKLVHTLVAECFIPKHKRFDCCVVHKDGNRLNNKFVNLKWTDRRGVQKEAGTKRAVRCIESGEVFGSIQECSEKMNIPRSAISRTANQAAMATRDGIRFEFVD